jgi:hypothetical protein
MDIHVHVPRVEYDPSELRRLSGCVGGAARNVSLLCSVDILAEAWKGLLLSLCWYTIIRAVSRANKPS